MDLRPLCEAPQPARVSRGGSVVHLGAALEADDRDAALRAPAAGSVASAPPAECALDPREASALRAFGGGFGGDLPGAAAIRRRSRFRCISFHIAPAERARDVLDLSREILLALGPRGLLPVP